MKVCAEPVGHQVFFGEKRAEWIKPAKNELSNMTEEKQIVD